MWGVYVLLVVRWPRGACRWVGVARCGRRWSSWLGRGVLFFRAGICRKKCRCFTGCGSQAGDRLCLYVQYFVPVGILDDEVGVCECGGEVL
jgi:hypothetical protein